ncbi:hypothetical protein Tco_0034323 [Tanacetum coccineum]
MLLKCIGELKQHMADLIQDNLALEESLDKHGTWLYNLENLNIPYKMSQAVDEIVTDAEETRKMKRKRRESPRTLHGSPPSQPPPPPPPAGATGAPGTSGASRSSQMPLPPPPPSTGTSGSAQQQCGKAPSSSKTAASTHQSIALTMFDTRYESTGFTDTHETTSSNDLMHDDSIPDEQIRLTGMNSHRKEIKSESLSDHYSWGSPVMSLILTQFFFNKDLEYLRYGSKGSSPALSISKDEDCLTGFYVSVIKEVRNTCGFSVSSSRINAYLKLRDFKKLYPNDFEDLNLLLLQGYLDHLLGLDKRMLSTAVKLWTQNLVIRQRAIEELPDHSLNVSTKTRMDATRLRVQAFSVMKSSTIFWIALDYRVRIQGLKAAQSGYTLRDLIKGCDKEQRVHSGY